MNNRVVFCVLLWLMKSSSGDNNINLVNVGTALYGKSDLSKNWTDEDVIKLRIRMVVEQLLPNRIPDGAVFIKYFELIVNRSEMIIESEKTRRQTIVMIADVIGGYMYGVLLPQIKMSYYDGRVDFNVTNKLYGIMRKIMFVLDTDGRGWINSADVEKPSATRGKENVANDRDFGVGNRLDDPCSGLYFGPSRPSAGGDEPVVIMPTFDDDKRPGSLVVPFKVGRRLFTLDEPGTTSDDPRPVLVRYYQLATACTAAAPDRFMRDFHRWADASLAPLLSHRNRWYPLLAGASRVIRAIDGVRVKRPKRKTSSDSPCKKPPPVSNWPACDDGPDGQLPNSNVFFALVLMSLTFTWVCVGIVMVHKGIRRLLQLSDVKMSKSDSKV